MSKQIHIKATHGKVDPATAPNRGTIDFQTGSAAANQLIAELSGKLGKQLENRPTIVIPFETEASAEDFKNFINGFNPATVLPPGMEEMGDTVTGMYSMGLAFADISRIGNELVLTAKDPIEMISATLGPFAPITSSLNCSIKSTVAFA